MALSLTYRRLRAPTEDGERLLQPPLADCLRLPAENAAAISGWQFSLQGHDFQALRAAARQRILQHAVRYSRQYADVAEPVDSQCPLVVTGHQPELFHPGVWAKNFAAHDIADSVGGTALNIIIDNDECRATSIRIPVGQVDAPQVLVEKFDDFVAPVPYEMRKVRNIDIFRSFASRVADRIEPYVADPLVRDIWPTATELMEAGRPLGHAMAAARHRRELSWGLRTLEVPLSQLADSLEFRVFVVDLLVRAGEVRERLNARLAEYRRLHHLRSPAQPLPDLSQSPDGWIETPFWIWTLRDPRRRALLCRLQANRLVISDGQQTWELAKVDDVTASVDQLTQLRDQGVFVRPRAISNTLFIRMFLADLFIHGIGGAKYDQITDLLVSDLYNLTAPSFLTLSLTANLPVDRPHATAIELTRLRQTLREMWHHPEVFLTDEQRQINQVSTLIAEKTRWVQQELPPSELSVRHDGIVQTNARLRSYLQENQEKHKELLDDMSVRLRAAQIWGSREWSFALFPANFLRDRLLDWSGNRSSVNAE